MKSTATPDATVTDLILELFRLNGRLLAAGDRLVGSLGLTSARWQVLGAIALSSGPEPVARIARAMGLQRQGVRRIVNELVAEGLLTLQSNPHHRTAKLVVLTPTGHAIYAQAAALQQPWAVRLAGDVEPEAIEAATKLLTRLRMRLEEDD